jgi:dihydropteroate synthase
MGILNITPDSFFDFGKYFGVDLAVNRAIELESLGADIIDIGGQSSHPNFLRVSPEEELERISPVLEKLQGKIHVPISLDSFYPEVAKSMLEKYEISIINDVNGFKNKKMFEAVSKFDCGIVIVHNLLDLINENNLNIVDNVEISDFFKSQIEISKKYKIRRDRICLDPGIGFGKSLANNFYILGNINKFKIRNYAFLLGASRKSFMKVLSNDVFSDERLYGTIAVNCVAQFLGANIIRVHDVKEAVQAVKIVDMIKRSRNYFKVQ